MAERDDALFAARFGATAGDRIRLGDISGASDGGYGAAGPASTCSMKNAGGTSSLSCGGTPAYHFYTAKLEGGALVVRLTTGVDNVPALERTTEVLRRATGATRADLPRSRGRPRTPAASARDLRR